MLKYLKGKDLLALRRVCRYGRSWASESSPSAWDSFQIEIRNDCGGWATFDAVVRSGLNVTAIYLNNPGDDGLDIYNSPGISGFMQTYGPHIRKLKVRSFGTFHSDSEFNFFESLPNLRELKIHVLDARNRKVLPEGAEPDPIRFPTSFRNMKLLKFGNIMSPMEPPHKTKYHWDLVRACPQLEYLRFPVASQDYDYPELTPEAGLYYEPIMNYMKNQRDSGIPVLKVLDLKYLVSSQDTMMSIAFPSFLCCMHLDFCDPPLFKNAHADMVFDEETNTVPLNLYRECCNISVASLINFTPNIRMLQLPNMTKLVINSTAWSSLSNLYFGEPDWCALKSISILFDGGNPHLSTLTDFIFKSKRRPSVERLSIIFDESVYKDMQLHGLISSRSLARNFENLKFLEMVRWEVKNRSLVRLWEGLKKLEELRVEDCKSFGNAALIGENLAAPAFLRLKSKGWFCSSVRPRLLIRFMLSRAEEIKLKARRHASSY